MGSLQIKVDKQIYHIEVLLKTAYQFVDTAYLHLSQDDKNWIISWTNKPGQDTKVADFENELITQQLRYQLVEKTSDIRKLMLARAFASTLIETNEESEEPFADCSPVNSKEAEKRILEGWYDAET